MKVTSVVLHQDVKSENSDGLVYSFTAVIDGVEVTGTVSNVYIGKKSTPAYVSGLRLIFDDKTIVKHKEYQKIRNGIIDRIRLRYNKSYFLSSVKFDFGRIRHRQA